MTTAKPYSNLDLVNIVDSFPNASAHPSLHSERLSTLSLFVHNTQAIGYLLPPVVAALKDTALSGTHWDIAGNVITLVGSTVEQRSENICKTVESWREHGTFAILKGWRDELYSVFSPKGQLYFVLERSACALFGVVHMTAYTTSPLRIWVPRRNPEKPTYGGLLDNTVAGGISSGMSIFETLVKESAEEASLPEKLIRENAKAVGHVSYFYVRVKSAGGEEGLLQPEVQYVYDLEVGEDVIPRPCDDEVQEFYLLDVGQVKKELANGSFKPNCSLGMISISPTSVDGKILKPLVILDFFVRHGIITPENEPDYIEISSRLHRLLEFPIR